MSPLFAMKDLIGYESPEARRQRQRLVQHTHATRDLEGETMPDQQSQEEPRRTKWPASMISPKLVRKHMRMLKRRQRRREQARQQASPLIGTRRSVRKLMRRLTRGRA